MDLTFLPILIALPVLVVAAAFCSSSETALFSLTYHDRVRLRRLSPTAADAAAWLLARPRSLLVTLVLANTMVNTLYYVLTSLLLFQAENPAIAIAIGLFNVGVLTILAEVVAKMLSAKYRVEVTRLVALPVGVLFRVLGPVRSVLDRLIVAPLARLIAPPRPREETTLSPDELSALLSLGHRQGAIDPQEQRILRQVIEFGHLRVRDVMTHRTDVEWLDEAATPEQVAELVRRSRLTRIPICRGTLDDEVVGLLNTKTYLMAVALGRGGAGGGGGGGGGGPRLADHQEPVRFVPQTATLDRMLEHLRSVAAKIALCVDEYGSITGVVATQDLVRRLIAEFAYEPEAGDEDQRIEMIGLGKWMVSGRVSVRDWDQMFGLRSDTRSSTVAGLVFARLGRLPRIGDVVTLGNVRLEVASLEGRMVDKAVVSLVAQGDAAPTPSAAGVGGVAA